MDCGAKSSLPYELLSSKLTVESGRRGGVTPAPHTTGHTDP